MLQNENSAYYRLVRDIVSHTDTDRLYTFGMNLGYNGCTIGVRRIRENENKMNCNIPWAITLQISERYFEDNKQKFHDIIHEGETLGIYVWMIFAIEYPDRLLSLAESHPDSAFFIFCNAEELTASFLDEVIELHNVMLVIRYEDEISDMCEKLREMGLLYSVWYQYGQTDTEIIINGDLFSSTQQHSPAFTVLLPDANCPEEVRHLVYQEVKHTRSEQTFHTIVWELQADNSLIDTIISDDPCSVYFDKDGNLCDSPWRYTFRLNSLCNAFAPW